jgi:hypothetical protein
MGRRFATLLVMISSLALPARAQISPGPLARAHRTLEGTRNCAQCHGTKRDGMTAACTACHKDIAWLTERKRGYHAGRQVGAKKECAACHPDHAGLDFELIDWPGGSSARFDHAQAGWALEGSHVDAKCEDCHQTKYRVSPSGTLSRRRDGAGWVGLESSCASCHREDDVHRGALQASCATCHDSRDWKPAPKFDHDSTDYPLTGRHTEATCAACHESARAARRRDAAGHRIPVYEPLAFRSCADCHEDPHRGRLTSRCADCHTTRGFEVIDRRDFNHELTRYPLRGKHRTVACTACHGADLSKTSVAFASCGSCHADPHKGEAQLAGKPADCGSCHRVEGFAPATYGVVQHQSAAYPLEGRHQQVACAKCHTKPAVSAGAGPVAGRIRMPSGRCLDCHTDAHARQLAQRQGAGACETCHAVAGWRPSTFTSAQHATLRLPLDGKHAAVTCAACHGAERPGLPAHAPAAALGTARVAVVLTSAECASCHVDAHDRRYAGGGRGATGAGQQAAAACTACHTTTAFRPSTVDAASHDRFTFRLEGSHRAVPCVSCHEELAGRAATSTLLRSARGVTRFPASPDRSRTCATCHETPHGEQFAARPDRGACESCHGVATFSPAARFDHDRGSSFSLAGAHANVPCGSCHRSVAGPRGSAVTLYRPTPTRCESCHDKRTSGAGA